MALFKARQRRTEQLEREVAALREIIPTEAFQGRTADSPYVDTGHQSMLPWRRNRVQISEAVSVEPVKTVARQGFLADVPRGGANEFNQGYTQVGGATDRKTLMEQLQMLYVSCPWASACVDTIARTSSAGGMSIVPADETNERKESVKLSPQAQKAQDLFDYVNPEQNFRQLMRTIFTDLLIYGDSFVEVVWALGEPIALFSLPCPDMLIDADEHGRVNFYVQRTDTDRRAQFEPHQVIHIKFDSPRGGLHGLGPTEKAVHPITTWLFTEGLLKSTMKKGDPPNVAFGADVNLSDAENRKMIDQYTSRNLGPDNVGNPVLVRGNTSVHEFSQNKIAEYNATKDKCRDEICGTYGTPPAKVTIIESGNLGGGTGTSQDKSFKVNTCGPIEELVLEALTFDILREGFGVTDYRCKFGEIDWRDDEVIEKIRTQRVERGGWTINRYRDDIDEPPVGGGDDAVIIQTRDVVLVKDLQAMSEAAVHKAAGPGETAPDGTSTAPGALPGPPDVPSDSGAPAALPAPDQKPPAHTTTPAASEAVMSEDDLFEAFQADLHARRVQALKELSEAEA